MAVAPVTDGKENQRAENYGAEEHEVRQQEEVKIIHVMGRGGCGVREKWNVKHHMSSRSSCLARLSCLSLTAYRLPLTLYRRFSLLSRRKFTITNPPMVKTVRIPASRTRFSTAAL